MKKSMITIVALVLSTLHLVSDDDFEIKLIDESAKSGMVQEGPIEGCNDNLKKEHTCSKEPEEIILSKLPTSSQLDSTNLDDTKEIESIKAQLKSILKEIESLRKEREENKKTIERLTKIIDTLTKKEPKELKLATIKSNINQIKRTQKRKRKIYPDKPIKIIEEGVDYLIVEVQEGESLSKYAKKFYGDNRKYYQIYKANRDKIPSSLEIVIGSRLVIPNPITIN